MARCADATFLSLIPFITPVLPGPGSDIRMKMVYAGVGWGVGFCRCLWVRLIGYVRDRTTQRGRFPVVPHVPVRMRTGGAQLSGHILESGVGHCSPVCGGPPHP